MKVTRTQYWEAYPQERGCAQYVGAKGIGRINASPKRWYKLTVKVTRTQYWEAYPQARGCAQYVGAKGIGRINASPKRWYLSSGSPRSQYCSPKEKLRKFFPMRNVVQDKNKDDKDEYIKYFPAISFADYGAFSSQIRDANKKFLEDKRKNPEMYPEIEPPADEPGEEASFVWRRISSVRRVQESSQAFRTGAKLNDGSPYE